MDTKCTIVLDEALPVGLLVNASAVLALTIGKSVEGIIDRDITDASGSVHRGITNVVVPILKTNKENLTVLREKAHTVPGVLVVDFSDVAQRTKKYDDYVAQLEMTNASDLRYLGVALYGDKKEIDALTGNLSLLR